MNSSDNNKQSPTSEDGPIEAKQVPIADSDNGSTSVAPNIESVQYQLDQLNLTETPARDPLPDKLFTCDSSQMSVPPVQLSPGELLLQYCRTNNIESLKLFLESEEACECPQNIAVHALCTASHNGFVHIAHLLLEHGVDPNSLANSQSTSSLHLNQTSSHEQLGSSVLSSTSRIRAQQLASPGSSECPLGCAIKYNHTELAKLLIDYGADALRSGAFERSPLQDAIRLRRNEILSHMCANGVNNDNSFRSTLQTGGCPTGYGNDGNVSAVLQRFKKDIVRQCLVNDNLEALTYVFIPHLWSTDNLNSDLFIAMLNCMMVKSRVQSDHTINVLHSIMECIPMQRLKLYDVAVLVRFFLRLLSAQFLSISDERITLLLYRANLFFVIIKYLDTFDFAPYLQDMDFAFNTIFDSVKDTGESKSQVFDFTVAAVKH